MSQRRVSTNPYPDVVSDRVWNLLHAWAEWRSVRSCPRCLPTPEVTGRWVMQDGRLVYDAVIAMQPRSTKPPDPGTMEVFNQCMMDLDEDLRAYLAAAVERQSEPWLRGESWRRWLRDLGVTRRNYERLLRLALHSLMQSAGRRRLQ